MKIDHDSIINQEIKQKFVNREVLACVSYEMEEILKAGYALPDHGNHSNINLPTTEQIFNLYVYVCPKCGESKPDFGDFENETEKDEEFHCPLCDEVFEEEPESEIQEIYEWWIITEYFYRKLQDKGEPVLEWGNNHYWGRTCTGQAILLDGVISEICEEMQILEGQKNDWSKYV